MESKVLTKRGGTRGCRAPETLKGTTTQTAAVDVWGAGIILLSLITGKIDILSRQAQKIKGEICDATHSERNRMHCRKLGNAEAA